MQTIPFCWFYSFHFCWKTEVEHVSNPGDLSKATLLVTYYSSFL